MPESSHKAEKGLIRVQATVKDGRIARIMISGDFFLYPEDQIWMLEKALLNVEAEREEVFKVVKKFYDETKIFTPGVKPEDFVEAIMKAIAP
jgi:hypothetical protein